jgi:hypothetical protein
MTATVVTTVSAATVVAAELSLVAVKGRVGGVHVLKPRDCLSTMSNLNSSLDKRLLLLEQRIISNKTTYGDQIQNNAIPLSLQIKSIHDRIRDICTQRTLLKDFDHKYSKYANLLVNDDYVFMRQILPPEAKAEMVLVAESDFVGAAESLDEVKQLEAYINTAELASVSQYLDTVQSIQDRYAADVQVHHDTMNKLSGLIDAYNQSITILSELFITWDHTLKNMEHRLDAVEKART